jgi:hypothetical protein
MLYLTLQFCAFAFPLIYSCGSFIYFKSVILEATKSDQIVPTYVAIVLLEGSHRIVLVEVWKSWIKD